MEKKKYIAPHVDIIMMDTTSIMAGSGGSTTSSGVLSDDGDNVKWGGEEITTGNVNSARVAAHHGYIPWSDYEDDF